MLVLPVTTARAAQAEDLPRILRHMCAPRDGGVLRYVTDRDDCRSSETTLSLPYDRPINICESIYTGLIRRAGSGGSCRSGYSAYALPGTATRYYCAAPTTRNLRRVSSPARCGTRETAVAVFVPIARDDAYAVNEDRSLRPSAPGVLANDKDLRGRQLRALLVGAPRQAATFFLRADGSFVYTPRANFSGTDRFTYSAAAGSYRSAVRTATITVRPVNDPPRFTKGPNQSVPQDSGAQAVNGWATAISPGPAGESGQTVGFQVTVTSNAALFATAPAVTPGGRLTYTPGAGKTGVATVSARAKDNGGTANGGHDTSPAQTFTITVYSTNATPVAGADAFSTTEDTAITAGPDNVLTNDTDADTDPLTASLGTGPTHDQAFTLNPDGSFAYAPDDNFCGSDSFTYRATDGTASSAPATVTLTVSCVNDEPSFTKGADQTVLEGSGAHTVTGWATAVKAGPANESGQALTFAVTGNTNTALFSVAPAVAANGTLTYTADPAKFGTADVTLRLTDDGGTAGGGDDTSATQTFTITVTHVNHVPVAVGDAYTYGEDSGTASVTAPGVLVNDTDGDGDTLTTSLVTGPSHASSFALNANGSFSYGLTANWCGTDTFTYKASDGTALSASAATVTITVTCSDDAPIVTATGGNAAYTEDAAPTPVDPGLTVTEVEGDDISGATVAITANAAAGDVLAFTAGGGILGSFSGGALTLSGTASAASYQAALRTVTFSTASQNPSALTRTVTFTVTSGALTGTDTRGVTVAAVNDLPSAVDDSGTTDEDTTLSVVTPGVLANDTDNDPGDTKTVVKLDGTATLTQTLPSGASVTINANGAWSYDPLTAFQGLSTGQTASDSFTYTMQDGAGAQSTATVNLTINGISDAPTAVADSFDAIGNTGLFVGTTAPSTQAGKEISGSVLSNDTDPDTPQASLAAEPVTNAPTTQGGTITIESDGNFTYHPDDVDTGITDTFTYRVCDASPCNSGTVANATGTLSLPIAGQVWYVKNNQAAGGDGTSDTPFDTLAEAEAASGTGDTVYVFDGDNTSANLDTGYVMDMGERLIGESQPLSLDPDGGSPLPTSSLFAGTAGAQPTLTASNEDVVVLASNAEVDGVDLDPSGTGGGIAGGVGTSDVTVGHVNIVDTATAGTQPGIELDTTTGTNRFSDVTVTNGGSATAIGVRLNNAGTVLFASAGTVTIATTGAKALDAASTNLGSSVFDDITVTGSGTGAVRLSSTTGSPDLGDGAGTDLSLQTTSGSTPALDISSSPTVDVDSAGTDAISATGGPAVDIRNSNGSSFVFDSVSSTNSAGDGINLDTNLTSPFTANAGAISGAAGIAVDVNAGGAGGGGVTYAGALNDGSGQTAEITNRDGGAVLLSGNIADSGDAGGGIVVSGNSGGSVTFSGASKVLNTGAGTAVALSSISPGSTLSFTNGGLDIDATSGTGINASTNGGTLDVQGSGNTVDTTTGRALNVVSTPIGAADLTFQRISANGAANGIVLSSTGTAGGLTVTGTGAAGSGGTIQNTTSDAISLTTTRDVSLTAMNVQNGLESGILGSGVTNLTLAATSITNNGDDSGDVGVKVTNLLGTNAWSDVSVTGSALANVFIDNTSGTLTALDISGASHFDSLGTAFGANSVLIEMRGTAVMTSGSIDGATFQNNKPARGITVQAQDDGAIGDASTNAFVVKNSTFTNNGLQASFEQSGTADLTFQLLNNGTAGTPMTMPNTAVGTSHAVNVFSSSTSTAGTIRGRISGNHIGNPAVAGSGSAIGNGIRAFIQGKTAATLLIDGNTINQTPQARGIDIQVVGPLDASGSGPSDLTVTNNSVTPNDSTGFPASAIYVAADSQGGGTVTTRADIRGNTVPAGTAIDSLPTFLALDKVVGAAVCQLVDTGLASANATAQLTSTNTGSASASGGCTLIAGPIATPP